MLKGFKFKSKTGPYSLSIVEVETLNTISIAIQTKDEMYTVELDRQDWLELCELRYKVDFVEVEEEPERPLPPPVIGERAAGEEF